MPGSSGCGSSWLPQHVADASDGVDVAPLVVDLGLAPEIADVDGERVGARVEVVSPDPLEDQVAGQHLARVPEEQLEQVELDPGERELAVAPASLAGAGVELEVAEAQGLALFAAATAKKCAEAGEELGQCERLDQVVIRSGVEALDPVVHGVSSGEHEHRRVVLGGPHPLANL